MSKSENNSGGIGLVGLLTVAFVVLKLTGEITWLWLWVLSPIWIPVALVTGIALIIFIIRQIFGSKKDDWRYK